MVPIPDRCIRERQERRTAVPTPSAVGSAMHDRIIGALETCCRRGEILRIQNRHVDWERQVPPVRMIFGKITKHGPPMPVANGQVEFVLPMNARVHTASASQSVADDDRDAGFAAASRETWRGCTNRSTENGKMLRHAACLVLLGADERLHLPR